jgi:peptide deformylase
MAILEILKYPDPRLKRQADPVEAFDGVLRDLVRDLQQTMEAGPAAVGIAAPQVGLCQQVAIVDVSSKKRVESHGRLVMVNPEIADWEGMSIGREGCLSVPDYTGNVIRAEQILLRAFDAQGRVYEHRLSGFEARAVQHEIDHLDGMLFLDRLVSRRSDLFQRKVYRTSTKTSSSSTNE